MNILQGNKRTIEEFINETSGPLSEFKGNKKAKREEINIMSLAPEYEHSYNQMDSRTQHNLAEKKRRSVIKNAFEVFEQLIPTINENKKVSKAVKIRKGVEYIQYLKRKQQTLMAEINRLRSQNASLQNQLTSPPQNATVPSSEPYMMPFQLQPLQTQPLQTASLSINMGQNVGMPTSPKTKSPNLESHFPSISPPYDLNRFLQLNF
jgi:regulator of replication initiation timing